MPAKGVAITRNGPNRNSRACPEKSVGLMVTRERRVASQPSASRFDHDFAVGPLKRSDANSQHLDMYEIPSAQLTWPSLGARLHGP